MFASVGPPEIILGLVLILVLFGGTQVPKLARNLGRAQKEFKQGFDEGNRGDSAEAESATTAEPADK